MSSLLRKLAAGLFLAALLSGCAQVPGTGRSQLMLVSVQQESAMGLMLWNTQMASKPRCLDPGSCMMLERVGRRILAAAGQDGDWEFVLFENSEVNAFCLPGGKIGIYTGILPVMDNEAGMAVIVGHEVAHAVARHSAERISQAMAIRTAGSIIASTVNEFAPGFENLAMDAFGISTTLGIALPFSRSHEEEADYLGLVYMSRAGYDPDEAVRVWQRMMARKNRAKVPEFLSTHPCDEKRIAKFQVHLPEAMTLYAAATEKFGQGEKIQGMVALK